jgi:diaminohydroxyphosphoribosylaminopyrimidine deaminase / 5-amino-6-(5-phosphoribosylamino)uracil reductase
VFERKNQDEQQIDSRYMEQALALAAQGQGYTSPNPAVGTLVVLDDQIVGAGYHRRAGQAHAEVEALQAAGPGARGSTLYVTLEPCNHTGKTPPCTEAIIAAGVKRVVFATGDPNPKVSGRGRQRLEQAGIAVTEGVCQEEAQHLNRFFFHYIPRARPYVVAKFACSLDGKIATQTGDSRWITGREARQKGHLLRHLCDAIVVGAGTALADDPVLTTRLENLPEARHPVRVLLDSRGTTPLQANLFKAGLPGRTLVATTSAMPEAQRQELARCQVEVLLLPPDPDGRVNLFSLLEVLGERQIVSLLIEGGGKVLGSFFSAGLVNEVWAFLAPLIIGGDQAPGPVRGTGIQKLSHALRLQGATVEKIGSDYLIKGYAPPTSDPVPGFENPGKQ